MRLEKKKIAQVYLHEWTLVAAISEPLDWETRYVVPEWRVGS
jgi:hypothetical protein